jgi:endonuclease YncB( thermonuclease family)
MARRVRGKGSWFTVLLIIAALAVWMLEQRNRVDKSPRPSSTRASNSRTSGNGIPSPKPARVGTYEVHRGCTLVEHRNNDGDSFRVRLPDGRVSEFRLYFVDTPESAFKTYRGGETNHTRIRQQAADLGGITPEQAVEIGMTAKKLTLGLLQRTPFTLHTVWDSPYQDERYHAFIEIKDSGKPRWLHELLIERGLARILTKPADLPDGTPAATHRQHLRDLESAAKRAGVGAWGL